MSFFIYKCMITYYFIINKYIIFNFLG